MNKLHIFFKKIIKAILWVVAVFVLIFLIVAGIIQIPDVQTKIVHYATTFVSNKTHTRVEIHKLSIEFPKSVVIEELFLEDLQKDTLIYAGKAKINIALLDLIINKITVNSVTLESVKLNTYNTKSDSLFNYNFLIKAFADSIKQDVLIDKTPSKWTFRVDNVSFRNIQLLYNDAFGGFLAALTLEQLDVSIDMLDIENSIYKIDNLFVENINVNVLITESNKINDTTSSNVFPIISAKNIQINNSKVTFGDSINKQSVWAGIKLLELKTGSVDLQNELLTIDKIYLSESDIRYKTIKFEAPDSTSQVSQFKNEWKVIIRTIDLNYNNLAYNVKGTPVFKNCFDPNNLKYSKLYLNATDLLYTSDTTKVSINEFSAIDQNNFAITKGQTLFKMDNHSITAQNLIASTPNSFLEANIIIRFESLALLKESLPNMVLAIKIEKSGFSNSDILYFSPSLVKQDFFKNRQNITNISGYIFGPMKNLKGKNIVLSSAKKTVLKTDFNIVGLPKVETAFFLFPNMKITTGREDLQLMLGSYLPKKISLPNEIKLLINFKGRLNSFETALGMNSTYGEGNIVAVLDPQENFSANMRISSFDVGRLLQNNDLYGPLTLTAEVIGKGLDSKTMKAKIKAYVSEIYLNKYNYHNLAIEGSTSGKEFTGKVSLNDKNAVFDFNGLVNLFPNKEHYKFQFNILGADLQKLNFTKDDIRIAMNLGVDLKGGTAENMNGKGEITNLILTHNAKKYELDSVMAASVNLPNNSQMSINSPLLGLNYSGSFSPALLANKLSQFINSFFPFSETKPIKQSNDSSAFNFEMQLHNHPIISEVLLPELNEFEPGLITGSYNSTKNRLKLNAFMKRIVYGTTQIDDLALDISSDSTALNYKLSSASVSNSQVNFSNLIFDGKLANNKISTNLSSIEGLNKKLVIRSEITKEKGIYRFVVDPSNFYLMNNRWDIAHDNYIEFGKPGFRIHHLYMSNAQSMVNIASVNNKFNDDINIKIQHFKLDDISRIFEKDTSLLKGNVDGNILLKRVNNTYGIIADASISNLIVKEVPIGNVTLKANNPINKRFDLDLQLNGSDNNFSAKGFYIPNGGSNSIHLKTDIQSLSMKTVEAFSFGQISQSSGLLTGSFLMGGKPSAPELTGELTFNNVFVNPSYLNNRIELKHETIQLKSDGVYFNKFSILDNKKNTAIIDGAVHMKQFSDFVFALHATTKDFLLFNTTRKDNDEFYGRMIIDSKIDITGPLSLPVINAKVKMKNGSNFCFAVPEDKLTTNKGEDVIKFVDTNKYNTLLTPPTENKIAKLGFTGFDLSSNIEVDKNATLKLLMDPTSSDSLVVKGEAALSFAMDRSGKMSLTGAYNLNEGSYLISLEQVVKRKFDIVPGSSIIWNGDPLDANISINATYTLRAAPYDLVANQMAGLSDTEKGSYKQLYSFQVLLKLRGAILKPEISFEIQLLPADKGILGGAVNQKLNMLNEDLSLLNKQVFALLIMGRFVQENPLQTELGGASTLIRSSVSNFLSTQLNQLSSKFVPGVEMNFDIKSYDDYQTGTAQGRTQVGIGLKKQLFNERLSVQVGGNVDVEGAAAKQNSASNITGDVTVEYKLTKDGRYRLKGFRRNQYEGAIEGQLIETGVGVGYIKDFNTWKKIDNSNKKINP